MNADGTSRPAGGTLSVYEPPSGRGVRVDGFGYAGYRTSARYDSLLAKLIVHADSLEDVQKKAYRALGEFRIEGAATNIPFLQTLLRHPRLGERHTSFVEEHIGELLGDAAHRKFFFEPARAASHAGVKVDNTDPLAVLAHGKRAGETARESSDAPDGATALRAPLQGTIIGLTVKPGDTVRAGQPVLVMEAMKMEHVIEANVGGVVRELAVAAGDTVFEDAPLAYIEEGDVGGAHVAAGEEIGLDAIRPDLQALYDRKRFTLDEARPDAVARRRKTGQRTTRENIEDLCDPGSFTE
jgi:acetyl/propionyl-CoA carboxylase alpha subunit